MPDFAATQSQLNSARAASVAAQAAAALAGEKKKTALAQLDQLNRRLDPGSRADLAEQARLQTALRQAAAELTSKQSAVSVAGGLAASALGGFSAFTDPRDNVSLLSDRSPFLLVPVRLETRFVASGENNKPQLWVRIYPDDFSIDTFEPTLSANELKHAKSYWAALWAAGGVENDQRAAWRALVSSVGNGRAAWIADNYQPANPADQPTKAASSDEILIIPTQTALSATEAAATTAYWKAIWLADGNSAKSQAAQTTLQAAVGAARAAHLVQDYVPVNLTDVPTRPATKATVTVSVVYIVFPTDPPTQQASWSQAPRVNNLADRFVVLGYTGKTQTLAAIGGVVSLPLYVGPDPSADPKADPTSAIHPDGPNLFVPDQLNWLFDFDRAIAAGMGMKIDITAEQLKNGFDRLLVLGLQLSTTDAAGKTEIENLIQHHHYGRAGFAVVPQGTPTHNTTGTSTGYASIDNPDQSFDDRKQFPLFTPTADPLAKRDGQWLAELLGIDPAVLQKVHASGVNEQMQARAMQTALWPATLGYWMNTLLTPIFDDQAIADTRWYFTSFVSGRGAAPAFRVGAQPYGVLPTTAYSRIAWFKPRRGAINDNVNPRLPFLSRLQAVLQRIGDDWMTHSADAAHVGKSDDPLKTLLDIVGLHPNSVEFYSRYAETLAELLNIANTGGMAAILADNIKAQGLERPGMVLLSHLGYSGSLPDILNQFYLRDSAQITNLIDDQPLSETSPIRPYTVDGHNYIEWLITNASLSLSALYQEDGFIGGNSPQMLLYLYLRHALQLGYHDTSYNLHKSRNVFPAAALAAMKPEPAFIHVADGPLPSESRFATLLKTEPAITGSPSMLVCDYISKNFLALLEGAGLAEQINAMNVLKDAPTASLERGFVEHLDCGTYRYDAWHLGLVNYRLQQMRGIVDGNSAPPSTGTYIGAYGWVENLRPTTAKITERRPPVDLLDAFADSSPLYTDPTNGGYIHAPSLGQANTAAALRSGYIANASKANPGAFAVNLSSDRVRLALSVLEGIRNGQSLGALLGYQFERGLHDDYKLTEVDQFIFPLRKAFPLVADAISTTKTDPGVSIEAIEARNVMDGAKLATQIRSGGAATYPFGAAGAPIPTADQAAAINAQANALLDIYDAISDLALAEGVHQAVQGNFERIAGTLDAYTTGHFPPEPQVIQTPSSGIGLTHRFAIHLKPGLPAPLAATPRAIAEPALDACLSDMLPPLDQVQCQVTWTDSITSINQKQIVSLADLGVRPIDLLNLIKPDDVQSMTELDDRIIKGIIETRTPRPDAVLSIKYMAADAGKLSIFQAMPLLRSLKAIVGRSRPLRPTDSILSNDARQTDNGTIFVDPARIAAPRTALDQLNADITTFLGPLTLLIKDVTTNQAAIVAGIDGFTDAAIGLLERAAQFNIDQSGWGFAYDWKRVAFTDLLAAIKALVTRWNDRLAQFNNALIAYGALPAATPDAARFTALRIAEALISTTLLPTPATPALLLAALGGKKVAFSARLGDFQTVLAMNTTSFTALLAAAALATADFDSQPLDLDPFRIRATVFAQDLAASLASHAKTIQARGAAAADQQAAYAAAASPAGQAAALQSAAQAIFGKDFVIYPEFTLSDAHAAEWSNTVAASTSGALTQYLTATVGIDFPVDEWLNGVARVRPNIRSWEQLINLTTAFAIPSPALVPAQFPFKVGEPWLAMQFSDKDLPTSDRLLYTAHYAAPFDKIARQCGILLDEWTEVIPSLNQHTGITFNFDRPNSEAPQSLLLVTPASATGSWQWEDLVGALNETLDMAKKRAVEPAQIDRTAYARFLPATVTAAAAYAISITTVLAVANNVMSALEINANA